MHALLMPLLLATAQLAAPAAPRLIHVPLVEAYAGAPLQVEVRLPTGPAEGPLRLYWTTREGGVREAELLRTDERGFAAQIPEEDVVAPRLAYWIAELRPSGPVARFASAAAPQPVLVRDAGAADDVALELRRRGGLVSEFATDAEWADFGDGATIARAHGEYRYARLGFFEEISIGGGTLEATTSDGPRAFRYGESELVLRPGEHLVVAGKVLLGVADEGFAAGGEARLEIGRRGGSRLELAGGRLQRLGDFGRVGLRWDTVPPLELGTAIEVTTLPDDGPAAVRLLCDAALPLGDHVRVSARGGWQARGDSAGGFAAGLGAGLRF